MLRFRHSPLRTQVSTFSPFSLDLISLSRLAFGESAPSSSVLVVLRMTSPSSKSRLSREEKGKDIVNTPSPGGYFSANGSPLDEFDLIHRDAMWDTET